MVPAFGCAILVLFGFSAGYISSLEISEISVNVGENVTLACLENGHMEDIHVMWVKDDRSQRLRLWRIQGDGSLSLPEVDREDSGMYSCVAELADFRGDDEIISGHALEQDEDAIMSKYNLVVKTAPGRLVNVSVHPSTVLALLLWDVGDTGDCDISYFSARYKLSHSQDWLQVPPNHISPNTRQIDVYHLSPNATYDFQVWATNELGEGEKTTVEATTKAEMLEIELARHLLQGVESFDTRVWVAAVCVVMGTLLVLSLGTCYLMFRDHRLSSWTENDEEIMELVPNIIMNPAFLEERERGTPDENTNDQPHVIFNNNSIVRPIRV